MANFTLWAVLLVVVWICFPKKIGPVFWLDGQERTIVHLPCQQQPGVEPFETTLTAPARSLTIEAQDYVELARIDGQTWFAAKPEPGLTAVYSEVSLPSKLSPGPHTLRFAVRNRQGEVWFDIKEAHGITWVKVVVLLLWGAGAFALARRCGYGAWVGWPVALAGLLAIQYVDVTTPWVRQHDVGGHREYIDHLSAHLALPAVQQGWETWQPPLYYTAAALWRWPFPRDAFDDPFRPVQFFAALIFLTALALGLPVFHRLKLSGLEAAAALAALALPPGNLFFAARINNDVLLPLLGGAVMFTTAEFVRTGERRWLWWLAALLPATLATKGSSLAIVGGALLLVLWSESQRAGWRTALWRTYLAGLPAGAWQVFWWARTAAQTGNPLYVNAALPDNLRILVPAWRRLLSFDLSAFTHHRFYYDPPMWNSYPTALVTSLLYDEYGMQQYSFHWSPFLRWGCLGMLLVLAAGILVRPRPELRPVWLTCLCLGGCQSAITVAYALQFPFACNQNMRFFAQAFVPFACLVGLGCGHFCRRAGWIGRSVIAVIGLGWLLGLGDFYLRTVF